MLGMFYYYFHSEEKETQRINKLPRNSQQVYSTNKQYLHVLIPSLLVTFSHSIHYHELHRKPDIIPIENLSDFSLGSAAD